MEADEDEVWVRFLDNAKRVSADIKTKIAAITPRSPFDVCVRCGEYRCTHHVMAYDNHYCWDYSSGVKGWDFVRSVLSDKERS